MGSVLSTKRSSLARCLNFTSYRRFFTYQPCKEISVYYTAQLKETDTAACKGLMWVSHYIHRELTAATPHWVGSCDRVYHSGLGSRKFLRAVRSASLLPVESQIQSPFIKGPELSYWIAYIFLIIYNWERSLYFSLLSLHEEEVIGSPFGLVHKLRLSYTEETRPTFGRWAHCMFN